MSKWIKPFAALALTASALGACSTVPVGGTVLHTSLIAGGIGFNGATSQVQLGFASGQVSSDPIVVKDGKGDVSPVAYADGCNRTGPAAAVFIDKGSASAVTNLTSAAATPVFNGALAIDQGLMVGAPATISQLAALQASAGPTQSVLSEFNACPPAAK